jgi:8-oxo-dGTP pyrophosphatase MutT (NUDIX family)
MPDTMATVTSEPPVVRRRTARVLPVNAAGQVLLTESCDPAHPETRYWSSIGGGVEGEESLAEAAARELEEETGLVLSPTELGDPFARSEITFPYNGATFVNNSSWFAVRLEADADNLTNLDPTEAILAFGWWTPEALRATGDLPNPQLPGLMAQAVAAFMRGTDG